MLFATPDGEGTILESAPKRAKIRLDSAALRLLRGQTIAAYQKFGLTITQIAEVFNLSERTAKSDLAAYRLSLAPPADAAESA